ncbi:hypothetical protein [Collinsella bouchesdurhonensis]|uniref:hypothetical protein n=1 Tax=Collinsella bouchesdurhonensis TaxID=1907654 RepID=UPI0034A3F1AB
MMDIKDTPMCKDAVIRNGAKTLESGTRVQFVGYDMNRLINLFDERIQGFMGHEWEMLRVSELGCPNKYAFFTSTECVISFGIDKRDEEYLNVYVLTKLKLKVPFFCTFGELEELCTEIIDTFNKRLTNRIMYGAKAETKIVDEYVDFLSLQKRDNEVDDDE